MSQNLNQSDKKAPEATGANEPTSTQIVARQEGNVNTFNAELIISQAISQNVPVETMERLLAMRRELKAEAAKEAFDRSMAYFQSECPVIEKKKKVDFISKRTGNRTNYSYAPLDVIVEQVKPLLQKYGFSYTFDTKNENDRTINFCKVTHELGHSEVYKFEVPIDKEAHMNEQQKFGSANTFGKRYAFLNAFGILTGDEDDDSLVAGDNIDKPVFNPKPVVAQENPIVINLIKDLKECTTAEQYTKVANEIAIARKNGKLPQADYSKIVQEAKDTVKRIAPKPDMSSPEVPINESPARAAMLRGMKGKKV